MNGPLSLPTEFSIRGLAGHITRWQTNNVQHWRFQKWSGGPQDKIPVCRTWTVNGSEVVDTS